MKMGGVQGVFACIPLYLYFMNIKYIKESDRSCKHHIFLKLR